MGAIDEQIVYSFEVADRQREKNENAIIVPPPRLDKLIPDQEELRNYKLQTLEYRLRLQQHPKEFDEKQSIVRLDKITNPKTIESEYYSNWPLKLKA